MFLHSEKINSQPMMVEKMFPETTKVMDYLMDFQLDAAYPKY